MIEWRLTHEPRPGSVFRDRMNFLGELGQAIGCAIGISLEDIQPVEDAIAILEERWGLKGLSPEEYQQRWAEEESSK